MDELNSIVIEATVETSPMTTGIQRAAFYVTNRHDGDNRFFVEARGIAALDAMKLTKGTKIRVVGSLSQTGRFASIIASDVELFRKPIEVIAYDTINS